MPKRLVVTVFILFVIPGMACNLSSNPAVSPQGPSNPTLPVAPSSSVPTDAPRPVTDINLEILTNEGSANVDEWTANVGCVPHLIDPYVSMVITPKPGSKDESHLKVAPDGSLEGTCYEGSDDRIDTGTLTGKIDWFTGAITFHLEARSESYDQGFTTIITMTLDGIGAVTSGDQAAGDSTWSAACRADSPAGLTCSPVEPGVVSLDVTGAVPWKMWLVRTPEN